MKETVFDPAKLNSGKTEWASPRPTLDELGIASQTDKASQFTRTYAKPHDYLRVMEPFFEPLRDQPINLLEIGVGGGESVRTWIEYFSKAQIYGADIVQGTNGWNTSCNMTTRYAFAHGDQGESGFWGAFIGKFGAEWSIVIDDGSHYSKDIIATFNALWPYLLPGGLYIIEDLNTAYGGGPFTTPGQPTQMDFIKAMLDSINRQERQIERIHFSRELCIIVKAN